MPGVTFAAGGDTHAADIPGVLALAHPVDADLLQRRGRVDAEPVRQVVPCRDPEGVLRPAAEEGQHHFVHGIAGAEEHLDLDDRGGAVAERAQGDAGREHMAFRLHERERLVDRPPSPPGTHAQGPQDHSGSWR